MTTEKLSEEYLRQQLFNLPGWVVKESKLHRQYRFADFSRAIGFMTTAAIHIEKLNHHPEWSNVYSTVTVNLISHDVGGITSRDVELAHLLDRVAAPEFTIDP